MTWAPKTLHDHFPTLPPRAYDARVVGASPEENHLATCDHCGRRTNADMLMDVRELAPEVRAALGLTSEGFLCDASREWIITTTRTPRARFYELLGAPPAIVEAIRDHSIRKGDDPSD